ncbi:hypothetical protein FZ103_05515 [Streptomonospora sp. PA3]|uniref:hypothetical protein n=1 Tax=Streptomonospora sp. PA3 TaxID=2607326 RepID=UPI00130BA08E|nr:hypothetical protein [Streptomonospora sp. PA3]MUL40642.1 hypothetical protein [Streptomonospora sp. PA3]
MSPKKKTKQTRPKAARTDAGSGTGSGAAAGGPAAGGAKVSRTPVVLDDRRRWPVAVWTALAAVWALGSLVFFVLFLAEGFAVISRGPGETAFASMSAASWYLLGLVVCALAAPLAGAVWAAVLRRRIAAILFTAALVCSAAVLFSLDSPAGIAQAIANGIAAG